MAPPSCGRQSGWRPATTYPSVMKATPVSRARCDGGGEGEAGKRCLPSTCQGSARRSAACGRAHSCRLSPRNPDDDRDRVDYQTVYARPGRSQHPRPDCISRRSFCSARRALDRTAVRDVACWCGNLPAREGGRLFAPDRRMHSEIGHIRGGNRSGAERGAGSGARIVAVGDVAEAAGARRAPGRHNRSLVGRPISSSRRVIALRHRCC